MKKIIISAVLAFFSVSIGNATSNCSPELIDRGLIDGNEMLRLTCGSCYSLTHFWQVGEGSYELLYCPPGLLFHPYYGVCDMSSGVKEWCDMEYGSENPYFNQD